MSVIRLFISSVDAGICNSGKDLFAERGPSWAYYKVNVTNYLLLSIKNWMNRARKQRRIRHLQGRTLVYFHRLEESNFAKLGYTHLIIVFGQNPKQN